MNLPLVSVVLPNFNGAPYLDQALQSLTQQPYSPIELIVVDDASTDKSLDIIETFSKKYPFIRVLRNAQNQGVVLTQERGVAEARGEFIHLTASDDMITSDLYVESVRLLTKYPSAGLCSGVSRFMDFQGQEIQTDQAKPIVREEGYWPPAKSLQYLRKYGSWFWGNTVIYRRSAFKAAGGLLQEFGSYSDNILCQIIALKNGVCYIPHPTGWWRRTATQYSNQTQSRPELALKLIERIGVWMTQQPNSLFPPDYVRLWQRRQLLELARSLMSTKGRAGNEVCDMLEVNLKPKSRWDQMAIDLVRNCPPIYRPILRLLKSEKMLPHETGVS